MSARIAYNNFTGGEVSPTLNARYNLERFPNFSQAMPSRDTPPSVVELAIAIADFKADDPAGLTDLQAIHEARRTSLLATVDAATTPEAVQAISVTYAV